MGWRPSRDGNATATAAAPPVPRPPTGPPRRGSTPSASRTSTGVAADRDGRDCLPTVFPPNQMRRAAGPGHRPHPCPPCPYRMDSAHMPRLTESSTDLTSRDGTAPALPRIPKGRQLTGEEAANFARRVIEHYTLHKTPIRGICRKTGRSYGAIHKLLAKHKVKMRPRGSERQPELQQGDTLTAVNTTDRPDPVLP
ncbi:helix-turn-helix domain-containing protein [Streptomyces sp. NPDC087532]|uniref:helix-turn-helix domain-containing protein n=1 Tax=Streptomyces sp. NPDC087532 TaxID=3365795 RepID=UPI003804B822